jgi:pyruvate carboxylase
VASITVRKGQKLTAGDVVLTIEAMKMETVLHAERDGEVAGILVMPGGQIDAKDLLVVFA